MRRLYIHSVTIGVSVIIVRLILLFNFYFDFTVHFSSDLIRFSIRIWTPTWRRRHKLPLGAHIISAVVCTANVTQSSLQRSLQRGNVLYKYNINKYTINSPFHMNKFQFIVVSGCVSWIETSSVTRRVDYWILQRRLVRWLALLRAHSGLFHGPRHGCCRTHLWLFWSALLNMLFI